MLNYIIVIKNCYIKGVFWWNKKFENFILATDHILIIYMCVWVWVFIVYYICIYMIGKSITGLLVSSSSNFGVLIFKLIITKTKIKTFALAIF